jgi:hypothetical protein
MCKKRIDNQRVSMVGLWYIPGTSLIYTNVIQRSEVLHRTVGGFAQNGRRFCTESVQRMYRNSTARRGEIMVYGVKLRGVLSIR